jgi:hypothetical protein
MQPVTSTHPSFASTRCNLHDDDMCTTHRRASVSLEVRLKTLAWLASRWSKPSDLDACPAPNHPPIGFVTQPTNRSLLSFEAQTRKLTRWFWGINHQTRDVGFEAQTGKPPTLVLRFNQETRPWFWGSTKKPNLGFEAQLRNPRSSSPRSRCRPHTTSPDLPIARPPSTRPVLDQPRSFAPGLLLLSWFSSLPAMSHLPPSHHETSKRDSPYEQR